MTNFTPERNQRIRALAAATAREINALTDSHEAQIKQIYDRFREQAAAIKAEGSADELDTRSADSLPTTDKQSQGLHQL